MKWSPHVRMCCPYLCCIHKHRPSSDQQNAADGSSLPQGGQLLRACAHLLGGPQDYDVLDVKESRQREEEGRRLLLITLPGLSCMHGGGK